LKLNVNCTSCRSSTRPCACAVTLHCNMTRITASHATTKFNARVTTTSREKCYSLEADSVTADRPVRGFSRPTTCSYPQPDKSTPLPPPPHCSLRHIMILRSHLRMRRKYVSPIQISQVSLPAFLVSPVFATCTTDVRSRNRPAGGAVQ
jgi:hypothetical protein